MASYELKTGNGGHGLEAYDKNTGKYTKLSFYYEGEKIDSWEDVKNLAFKLDPSLKSSYDSADTVLKEEFDNQMKDFHGELMKEYVGNLEQEDFERPQVIFHTDMELLENAPGLITKDFFDKFEQLGGLDDGYVKRTEGDPDSDYVEVLSLLMQESRYPNRKMKPISEQEWDSLFANHKTLPKNCDYDTGYNYLMSNMKTLPIFRGVKSRVDSVQKIHDGHFEDGPGLARTLLSRRGTGYYGSVTYMSMSQNYGEGYKSNTGGLFLKGYVEPSKLNVLFFDRGDYTGDSNPIIKTLRRDMIEEIYGPYGTTHRKKDISKSSVLSKIYNNLKSWGVDDSKAKKFTEYFQSRVMSDTGLCAMMMGYDAIFADGNQFDILNPSVVKLVK